MQQPKAVIEARRRSHTGSRCPSSNGRKAHSPRGGSELRRAGQRGREEAEEAEEGEEEKQSFRSSERAEPNAAAEHRTTASNRAVLSWRWEPPRVHRPLVSVWTGLEPRDPDKNQAKGRPPDGMEHPPPL